MNKCHVHKRKDPVHISQVYSRKPSYKQTIGVDQRGRFGVFQVYSIHSGISEKLGLLILKPGEVEPIRTYFIVFPCKKVREQFGTLRARVETAVRGPSSHQQ